ncbi:MAG: hypothetical protein ACJA1U_001077 [Bermanella sp.]|jgi:hypothetical protein
MDVLKELQNLLEEINKRASFGLTDSAKAIKIKTTSALCFICSAREYKNQKRQRQCGPTT